MAHLPPQRTTEETLKQLEQTRKVTQEAASELSSLINSTGYTYAKRMANGILSPYECNPGSGEKWDTYNTIRWAYERLFDLIELAAKNSQEQQ